MSDVRSSLLSLRARLAEPRALVLDGGLATELEARGFDLDDALWSARLLLEDPEALSDVHRAYVAAGAELVIAATYQASFEGFEARGVGRARAERLFLRAIRLARESGARYVAASIGPYGAAMANGSEYSGDYPGIDRAGLALWHRERFALLAASDADLLACETLPHGDEVRALVELASEHPERAVWFSFSCRDEHTLRDGTPVRELAAECAALPNAVAVGINCTAPRHVEGLVAELRSACELPIVVYPNSGEAYDVTTHSWSGERDVASLVQQSLRWRELGVQALGGCCRTDPEFVRSLSRALA